MGDTEKDVSEGHDGYSEPQLLFKPHDGSSVASLTDLKPALSKHETHTKTLDAPPGRQ